MLAALAIWQNLVCDPKWAASKGRPYDFHHRFVVHLLFAKRAWLSYAVRSSLGGSRGADATGSGRSTGAPNSNVPDIGGPLSAAGATASVAQESGASRYDEVRRRSVALCEPLAVEDYGVQPIVEASPPKWHLAHTTWFFETFLLKPFVSRYRPYREGFEYLFNSYYDGIGEQFPRAERGRLSRPTVAEVLGLPYAHVDDAMQRPARPCR